MDEKDDTSQHNSLQESKEQASSQTNSTSVSVSKEQNTEDNRSEKAPDAQLTTTKHTANVTDRGQSINEGSPGRSKILPMSKSLGTDPKIHKPTVGTDASNQAQTPTPALAKIPQQTVPNMTPGISNFLRQQNPSSAATAEYGMRKQQPDARGSHTAKAAIQNLAKQVRELAPSSLGETPPQPPPSAEMTKIIKELKERQDAELATAKAKSAAAAIHTIAFGVKSAVGSSSPSRPDTTNSSKDILKERVMRQKAKKEIEKSSARHMAGFLDQNVVDLSQGSDELGNESETSRAGQRSASSVAAMFQPTRGQSTRNPQRWEGRGWSKGSQQKQVSHHQQLHGLQQQAAHRTEAENAALLQNRLLQSMQTDQQQKQSHSNLGSGWTAREAALIAESNPDTVQKILAAQSSAAAAEKHKSQKKEPHQHQQDSYASYIARQHQSFVDSNQQARSASMGGNSSSSAPASAPSPARRRPSNDLSQNDAAMATLVRKLLGAVPVRGDEPPVVLGPQLIALISDKLKQVINRMVEVQDERSGDKRKRSEREDSDHNNRLKAYAQQQVDLVREQQMQIDAMKRQLDEKSAELVDQRNEINALNSQRSVEDDPAIQNLLKQLETGMQTAARQKKEITALRAVINQDAADIQQKDDVIGVLRGQLEQNEETMRSLRADTSARESVTALRQELKHLQDTLENERRQSETTTRAYMRAAVHALKVQNRTVSED